MFSITIYSLWECSDKVLYSCVIPNWSMDGCQLDQSHSGEILILVVKISGVFLILKILKTCIFNKIKNVIPRIITSLLTQGIQNIL